MVSFFVDAVLFDMDGTLVDSTPGVIKAWTSFAADEKYEHLQLDSLISATHGVRLVESLHRWFNITDPDELQAESKRFEEEVIAGGPVILPGVELLLQQLADLPNAGVDPKWTIPAPDPYLEGAKRCNADPTRTLVVEDAPSGIRSGRAAGAKTLAVLTSHTEEEMLASGVEPDYIVRDLSHVSVRWAGGKIQITISS
ncbi:hypothetical protein BS47DRAFT_1372285 [Hydnum rufescens UP504]|uniref:Uncharacterized protein n=1 Tax=Hydnum rufescens UP504 TaxID=1448309 RepID=A0A9P6DXB8_9AGAM|nr:hypothetical protein BS47DRAFT_1372285 [Hydnum rufescens UP504]